MSRKLTLFLILSLALSLVLAACAPAAAPEPAPVAEEEMPAEEPAEEAPVALQVTGAVASPQAWTEDEVKALDAIDVEATNKDGETKSYTGVLLSDLIAAAEPNADASMVTFIADDGYSAEIELDKVMACADCIASFRNKGGFSTVLPEESGKLQVKGLVEIQVQ